MWRSRTKKDLIIEVWEKLDCESVGRAEIEALETVIADLYGEPAVDPPMVLARLVADEGAELRHSEIMELHVDRASDQPYAAAFQNLLNFSDLKATAATIRRLENLRRKYLSDDDKQGLRHIRESALHGKQMASEAISNDSTSEVNFEIERWFSIWLQTPELFEAWVDLRLRSADFVEKFGSID
ncbi:hypothetical protein BH20ACI2_BH20ACI2_26340 [soil metagenome]